MTCQAIVPGRLRSTLPAFVFPSSSFMPLPGIGLPLQPTATRPAEPSASPPPLNAPRISARRQAIEIGLLGVFLRGTVFRQRVGGGSILVFAAFCYGHVSLALLCTWLAAG